MKIAPTGRWAMPIVLCLLSGCGSVADLDAYISEVKARPGPPLDPLPVMHRFETFEYSAHLLRDPFSKPKDEASSGVGEGPRPDPTRRKELLESFPLDGLDMVGTLGEADAMVALVIDPDRVIHRVVLGNHMGQNEGKIVAIAEDKITLSELVSDGAGGWERRETAVALDDQ